MSLCHVNSDLPGFFAPRAAEMFCSSSKQKTQLVEVAENVSCGGARPHASLFGAIVGCCRGALGGRTSFQRNHFNASCDFFGATNDPNTRKVATLPRPRDLSSGARGIPKANRRYALIALDRHHECADFLGCHLACLRCCSMESRRSWNKVATDPKHTSLREIVEQIAEVALDQASSGTPRRMTTRLHRMRMLQPLSRQHGGRL